jgi:class 3 adenylate cyclase
MVSFARLILPDGSARELRGSLTLGRDGRNGLVLDNGHVSSRHALVQWQQSNDGEPGAFFLIDLGSTNGSHVNGERIIKPARLKDGDTIRLGGIEMVFRTDAAPAAGEAHSVAMGSTLAEFRKSDSWLLVADIIGSTRMAQTLPPEQVAHINGTWFKSCREVIEAHQGHINQYLGDGLLGFWEHNPDTPRQVTAFLRQITARQAEADPAFRVVLHFGTVGLGAVPTLTSLNLHGSEVNFAFRMEKLAASLGENLLLSKAALVALGLPARVWHEAELQGFDGKLSFAVPDLARS